MDKVKNFIVKHKRPLIIGGLVLLLVGVYLLGRNHASVAVQEAQPVVMSQDLTDSINALQNKLDISEQNAKSLAAAIAKIQAGQTLSTATYYVTAPTVEKAADIVQQQIKNNDPTLPPAVLENTDRTVVTPITKDSSGNVLPADQQKVDVYKIDLRKDHRIKVGATIVDSKAYEAVGYEQGRFEAIAHAQGKEIKGGTVMWNAIEW
ncbi:deoxycytidylate deaminase [Sporomusaceae bacterium BoRhaA]|uniref:glycoprotease n=1 Tax=Pelorhabdus rhamnosifermentans TaxID=2772457 RepID=UPI001C05FE28|nr:glycoprotease [Pelorhabdus rhamnosifermentans]MBU2704022.1 deoxycytidylate deaminase [Pelorhabdus rhamnosifermentans]